jgi:hypothetical protein
MAVIWMGTGRFAVPPSVSLLLHGDGANGSTAITDSSPSPKTVTVFGNTQISTAQSKFGGASLLFDGSGDYLTISNPDNAFVFSGDFTIEAWVRRSTGLNVIYTNNSTGEWNSRGGGVHIDANRYEMTGIGSVNYTTGTIAADTWTHLALVRSGSSVLMFINGNFDSTRTSSTTIGNGTNVPGVGLLDSFAGTPRQFWNGYIDELRVSKVAQYTANFTPPAAPFPDS